MFKRDNVANPPAVILGCNEIGLAVARDLAAHGVAATMIHCDSGKPPAAYSRFARFCNAPAIEDETALVAWLTAFAERAGVTPVLVPAQDQAVLFIHAQRAQLAQSFKCYLWDADVLAQIGSKVALGEVAERYGLPVPRTAAPQSRVDIRQISEKLRFPCIVKPEFTNLWWSDAARELGLSKKAIEVNSPEELLGVYERSERVGARVVVQEKVVGPDSNHMSSVTFVHPSGDFTGEMVARKLRLYPARFGVGSYVEACDTEDAIRVGRDILTRLGYRGYASVQLKRDERDGRLYMFEINTRFSLLIGLPIGAGLSFPYYYYRAALGLDYQVGTLRVGHSWMSAGRDFRSMQVYARERTWTWTQWLWQLMRCKSFALFRLDDPMPAIMSSAQCFRAAVASRLTSRRWESQRFSSRGKTPT
jgi:D-aspartate ligase